MDIKLNERIRLLRNGKGLTQKELADLIDITEQTLNKYEKGHRIPDADCLNRMVNALECRDPGWLLTGKESTQGEHPCAGLEKHCPKFKNILLSDHQVIKDAFVANLHAFDYSITKERENDTKIDNLGKEIRELRKVMSSGRRTGTDAVASSNTGKRET